MRKNKQRLAHTHDYERREVGFGGPPDYVCRTCGFRIPENSIEAAVAAGAILLDSIRLPARPIEVTPRAAAWNRVRDEMAARDAERLR